MNPYEEYGCNALLELCGDQEVIDTIDGFMDWTEFGEYMAAVNHVSLEV